MKGLASKSQAVVNPKAVVCCVPESYSFWNFVGLLLFFFFFSFQASVVNQIDWKQQKGSHLIGYVDIVLVF